jgi:membrane-associated protein
MEWLTYFINLFLHLDKHLGDVIAQYGPWTYLILLVIVFCETGLVVTPFLPGDSLLFAVGVLAAIGGLKLGPIIILLAAAAILGDAVNYSIGYLFRQKVIQTGRIPFVKKEHLDKAHRFYEKYGKKAIFLARFVPFVRTLVPFLAGVGSMTYWQFAVYNVIGGITWIVGLILGGYYLGNLSFFKNHFSLVTLIIILLSLMPIVYEYFKARREIKAVRSAPVREKSAAVKCGRE